MLLTVALPRVHV